MIEKANTPSESTQVVYAGTSEFTRNRSDFSGYLERRLITPSHDPSRHTDLSGFERLMVASVTNAGPGDV